MANIKNVIIVEQTGYVNIEGETFEFSLISPDKMKKSQKDWDILNGRIYDLITLYGADDPYFIEKCEKLRGIKEKRYIGRGEEYGIHYNMYAKHYYLPQLKKVKDVVNIYKNPYSYADIIPDEAIIDCFAGLEVVFHQSGYGMYDHGAWVETHFTDSLGEVFVLTGAVYELTPLIEWSGKTCKPKLEWPEIRKENEGCAESMALIRKLLKDLEGIGCTIKTGLETTGWGCKGGGDIDNFQPLKHSTEEVFGITREYQRGDTTILLRFLEKSK